jgi:type VI secretion system secreted protein VgrG
VPEPLRRILGLEGERIDIVRYGFIDIDGPGLEWHVRRVHWSEGLSQTYELTLDILTDDLSAECDELLGAQCELEMTRGGMRRTAYGIIHRVDYIGVVSDAQHVRVYVVPAFHLLSQQIDSRIFQGVTAVEIIKEVLEPALAAYERKVDLSTKVKGDYNKRDYCVQYRESDLEFVCRLMEEEGIAYYFEPDDAARKEKLVLCDNNSDYGEVPLVMDDEVPIIEDRPELADRESLRSFDWCQSEQLNGVALRAFNWKVPTSIDVGNHARIDQQHARVRELYDHDDRRQIVDDLDDEAFTGEAMPQREPMAAKRLELFTTATMCGQGRSNVTGFMPGLQFKLGEHTRAELDGGTFLLTRVVHTGDAPDEVRSDGPTAQPRYENSFECLPISTVFRPPIITPKPRVHGPETAIVVGPESEEVHTDKWGRIKIQFHWDRRLPSDGSSSCWVRVAQMWAGAGWGTWFIPRIGMEVVVEFLEGNPDRPVVTGCVYNGDNALPYTLPDDKTKSTIKTNSSVGGGGSNELRFEDLKGSEEIYTHAQKDYNEVVENNHSTTVHANQTNGVDGSQSQSIGGDQTMTVGKNRTVTIEGSQAVTINGSQGNSGVNGSKLDITGDYEVDASNTIELQARTHIKLSVGESSLLIEPTKITITAGGGAKVVLEASALMHAAAVGTMVFLSDNALVQSQAQAKVFLSDSVLVQSRAAAMVLLNADASMSGTKATVRGTGATLELTTDASLAGANVSVSGSAKVGIAAAAVSSAATGTNEIVGAVIKIN